jgi:SAM-dependent methyltransferase
MSDAVRFSPAGRTRAAAYNFLWAGAEALYTTANPFLSKTANALLYLAAGVLLEDDLRAAGRIRWALFGTSSDDQAWGLQDWERRLFESQLTGGGRVLLVGCGTGRDLIGLIELGHEVTALDLVPELVELARHELSRRGLHASVFAESAERVQLVDRFDAILFSNGSYASLQPARARIATLIRMKERLAPGGCVFIIYMAFVARSPWSERLTALSARVARADWHPERGDCFSRDHLARRLLRFEHLFRPGEVAAECEAAGLRVVRDESADGPVRVAVATA